MPVITLEISKLNREQKQQLVREMTQAVVNVTKLPPETVTVFLKEKVPLRGAAQISRLE